MEKKKSDAERIYEELENLVLTCSRRLYPVSISPDVAVVMAKALEYGEAKYKEGMEDAIEADVHPDIEEEMRARAEEYHEARSEAYQ